MLVYLIHFWEITLKWKNRNFFEKKLIDLLKEKIPNLEYNKEYWKLIILPSNNENQIEKALKTTFWISNWSKAFYLKLPENLNLNDNLKNEILKIIIKLIQNNPDKINSFKIETKRSNKKFQPNSMEINKIIWWEINQKLWIKIDIKNPEKIFYIEIWDKWIYIYDNKIIWLWWLPPWTSGRIVSLISGWIDSPVASYLMMKRWAKIVFLHAYFEWIDQNWQTKQKILELIKKLSEYQWKSKIYFVKMKPILNQILEKVPPKRRMLIFKRSIIKIANKIAEKENALAITMWDSLAQVASQTLENINVIYKASRLPILSPLIWFDKQQIIDLAKKIWTYDISIKPWNDLCSKISHKHPITKWNLELAEKYDIQIPENLDFEIIQV